MTSIRHLLNYMVLKQFTDKLKYIRDMSSSILLPSGRMSSIKNPLSAIMPSPATRRSRILQAITSCLSDVFPGYAADTNTIVLHGVTPTKNLAV